MKTSDITVYFLNPDIYAYRTPYLETLSQVGFKKVERIAFDYKLSERLRTIIMAHMYALVHAYDRDAFPLLLLEDDARLMSTFPSEIDVPPDAELVYLGGSNYCCGVTHAVRMENYSSSMYRVYNMVSAHAILIPNAKGCRLIMDCYTRAIFENKFNDVCLALASSDHLFLAPKDGFYFYQEGVVENITRIKCSTLCY